MLEGVNARINMSASEWSANECRRSKKFCGSRHCEDTRDFWVPSICHSAPLIPRTRDPVRVRGLTLTSISCEYKELSSTKSFDGIRLRTFGTKQVLPKIDFLSELDYQSLEPEPTFMPSGYRSRFDKEEKAVERTSKRLLPTRQLSKMQPDSFSTQHSDCGSADYDISEVDISAESKTASCSLRMCMLAAIFLGPLTLLILFSSTSMNIELEHTLSMSKLENDVLFESQSSLYGQHIVINALKSSLRRALVKKGVRVVTLFLLGPSGSGKSFTRKILQDAAINRGFAFARIGNDPNHFHISKICEQLLSKYYQDVMIVMEDIDHDIEEAWKQQDLILHSKHCAGFNRILFVMVSSVFSRKIQQYMFNQCKFKDERLSIQSKDVIAYISKDNKSKVVKFESSKEDHIIVPLIFLPLDIDHLKLCISKVLLSRGVGKDKHELLLNSVLNEIEFYPQCGMGYPESGCKLVESKVDYLMHRNSRVSEQESL